MNTSKQLFSAPELQKMYPRLTAKVQTENIPTYIWNQSARPVLSIVAMADRDLDEIEKDSSAILMEVEDFDDPSLPPAIILIPLAVMRKFLADADLTIKAAGLV